MRILFLDDNEDRTDTFLNYVNINNDDRVYTTETAEECIKAIEREEWDFVFLDHDLGGEVFVDSNREDCGMEVVRYLQKNKSEFKTIFVHTANENASRRMVNGLKDYGYNAVEANFLFINWKSLYKNLEYIYSKK